MNLERLIWLEYNIVLKLQITSDVKIGKFFVSITIDTFWFLSIIIDIERGKNNESGD